MLDARRAASPAVTDEGAHYKRAEIAVTGRALPAGFFDWADVAPFKASAPAFSLDLIARYVTTVSRLECGVNSIVFDLGCGTGWTTEWLVRLGYQAIGVDLCRDYVLAGMARRGRYAPHFVIGDVENMPLRDECIHAALSYDAFHHVPDRPRAMAEIARIMRPGATMVLTEPGPEHEHAAVSVDVMQEHGILERGFDQAGLASYVKSTASETSVIIEATRTRMTSTACGKRERSRSTAGHRARWSRVSSLNHRLSRFVPASRPSSRSRS